MHTIAYEGRKEVICRDSKLLYYPKNIPALSSSRTQSALRFRGFLGILNYLEIDKRKEGTL